VIFEEKRKTTGYTTRGKPMKKEPGSGVIFARELSEKNGGKDLVESGKGKQCTFYFHYQKA